MAILLQSATGLPSTVSSVSDYRCVSDCRSRGREFDPGLIPYLVEIDHEIISRVILLHSATGQCSAVRSVSDCRCVSDCRSRGREFDPGSAHFFCGD